MTTVFALLDCSTSSPIYKSTTIGGNINFLTHFVILREPPFAITSTLCQTISRLDIPISTCCVYTSGSWAIIRNGLKSRAVHTLGLYGFVGHENNPEKYGLVLKYKFVFNNDYPIKYDHCEKSNGVCGYIGPDNSFSCNCPTGFNTTTDCYYGQSWSSAFRLLKWQSATLLACLMGMILV